MCPWWVPLLARFRLPFPSATLGFGNLFRRHLTGDNVSFLDAIGIAGGTRQIEPHVRLNIVLRDTLALVIQEAEVELRRRVSLLRRRVVPLRSLLVVLRDTLTSVIQEAEEALRKRFSLRCRQAVPLRGILVILRDT